MKGKVSLGILLAAIFFLAAVSAPVSAQSNQSGCLAHRPKYIEGVFERRPLAMPWAGAA